MQQFIKVFDGGVVEDVEGEVNGATIGETERVDVWTTVVAAELDAEEGEASNGVTTELNEIFFTAFGETGGCKGETQPPDSADVDESLGGPGEVEDDCLRRCCCDGEGVCDIIGEGESCCCCC